MPRARPRRKKSALPQYRTQTAPNTFYPLGASKRVKDRKTWGRGHRGTDISTPCGSTARAVHPGTAQVATNPAWGGKVVVRVVSNRNGLVTSYGFLWRAAVQQGQIVQSGQALGTVGGQPRNGECALYFSVAGNGRYVNPTPWLKAFVGKPAPVRYLFDNTGFTVASFNMLGASHTPNSRYAAYTSRTPRALALLKARGVDVAGLQEFEQRQADLMLPDTTFKSAVRRLQAAASPTRATRSSGATPRCSWSAATCCRSSTSTARPSRSRSSCSGSAPPAGRRTS